MTTETRRAGHVERLCPLASITLLRDRVPDWDHYPFTIPVICSLESFPISSSVVFLVGENGTGKSTLMEALAWSFGFATQGGSRHMAHAFESDQEVADVAGALRLGWRRKPTEGYFLRTESFFNIATSVDGLGPDAYAAYGGRALHDQSHGESLLAVLQNRFGRGGFYLLDEPETALSPQRQMAFLVILHRLAAGPADTQVIIASHSPIILAYPNAQILSLDSGSLEEVGYEDTESYRVTAGFMRDPNAYLRRLLD